MELVGALVVGGALRTRDAVLVGGDRGEGRPGIDTGRPGLQVEVAAHAIDKEGIAIPFEVRSSLQATKHEEDGQAKVPLSADDCDRGSEACTNAEGGLRSEASTMQAQAGQARLQESHELLSSRNGSK